jgi:hypothetical protein
LDGGESNGFADGESAFGGGSECEGSGVEVVGQGELFGSEAVTAGARGLSVGGDAAAGFAVVFGCGVGHLGSFAGLYGACGGCWR